VNERANPADTRMVPTSARRDGRSWQRSIDAVHPRYDLSPLPADIHRTKTAMRVKDALVTYGKRLDAT